MLGPSLRRGGGGGGLGFRMQKNLEYTSPPPGPKRFSAEMNFGRNDPPT